MKSKELSGQPESSSHQSEVGKRIQRGHPNYDEPLHRLTEDRSLLSQRSPDVISRTGFDWRKELTEDGQKLYELLLDDLGDKDFLLIDATERGFDLNAAMDELRERGLLDESHPSIVRLTSKRL
jgi:hypothetical protein